MRVDRTLKPSYEVHFCEFVSSSFTTTNISKHCPQPNPTRVTFLHLPVLLAGLPVTHSLRVFDALEPIFNPFKSVLCVELTF